MPSPFVNEDTPASLPLQAGEQATRLAVGVDFGFRHGWRGNLDERRAGFGLPELVGFQMFVNLVIALVEQVPVLKQLDGLVVVGSAVRIIAVFAMFKPGVQRVRGRIPPPILAQRVFDRFIFAFIRWR